MWPAQMNSSGHNLLIKFQRMSSDRYGVLDSNLMSNIVFLNNIKYLFTVAQIKRTNRDLANQMLFMNNMHVSEKFVVAVDFFLFSFGGRSIQCLILTMFQRFQCH